MLNAPENVQLLSLQFHSQRDYDTDYESVEEYTYYSPGHYSIYGDEDEDLTILNGQEEENEGAIYYTALEGEEEEEEVKVCVVNSLCVLV